VGGSPGPTDGNNALIARAEVRLCRWFFLTDAAERGDAIFVTSAGDEIVIARCCRGPRFDDPVFFGLVSSSGRSSSETQVCPTVGESTSSCWSSTDA